MAERPGRARRVRKRSRWGADEIEYSSSGSSGDEQAGPDEAERACRLTESSSPSPARGYEAGYDDVAWIGMAGLDEFEADMLAGHGVPAMTSSGGQMTQTARLPVQELLSAPLNDFAVPAAAESAELPLSPTAGVAVYGAERGGGGGGVHPAEVSAHATAPSVVRARRSQRGGGVAAAASALAHAAAGRADGATGAPSPYIKAEPALTNPPAPMGPAAAVTSRSRGGGAASAGGGDVQSHVEVAVMNRRTAVIVVRGDAAPTRREGAHPLSVPRPVCRARRSRRTGPGCSSASRRRSRTRA